MIRFVPAVVWLAILVILLAMPWYTIAAPCPVVLQQAPETPGFSGGEVKPAPAPTLSTQPGGQSGGSSSSDAAPRAAPTGTPSATQVSPTFGPIVFCDDVAADGTPINPRNDFPAGTKVVTAWFTYQGMRDGMPWGQLWMRDGKVALEAMDETWTNDPTNWAAYYYEEDEGVPLSGEYTLTLFIEGAPVQHASFTVDAPSGEQHTSSRLGSIVFCEDVSDSGQPINPTDYFPEGAKSVWAYFTYENMEPGQTWGRYWRLNGEEYIDATGQEWEDGRTGWTSYSIADKNGLPAGDYTLTLYVGDQPVQEASLRLEEYAGPTQGYFGEITFSKGMTEEREPIGSSRRFDFGESHVYAIFPYHDMDADQVWAAEWVHDGEIIHQTGDVVWGEGPSEGITYLTLDASEGKVLVPGEYGLNLYMDGELARGATFIVNERPTPEPPSRPEDIMDPDLLPAWHRLASCPHPTIQELAQVTLNYHIPIRFGDVGQANASYLYNGDACNTQPGRVDVSLAAWNELSWEEVASKIAHELWHATQLLEGGYSCGCTVQKEFEAKTVELYVLRCLGREDILVNKWGGAWDWDDSGHGTFDRGKLWRALKEAYSHCDEYEP